MTIYGLSGGVGSLLLLVVVLAAVVTVLAFLARAFRSDGGVADRVAGWFTDTSSAFASEFPSQLKPADAIGELVMSRVPELASFGFMIESQAETTVVLARRFTPRAAYRVPLMFAAVAFVAGILSNAHRGAEHGGTAAAILVGIAIALSVFVKVTDRVTVTARASDDGTRISVAGNAPAEFRDFLAAVVTDGEAPIAAGEPAVERGFIATGGLIGMALRKRRRADARRGESS